MLHKLAIKRLTASDLTFFRWHYLKRNAGNQKAINLNADVFVDALYPTLSGMTGSEDRLPVDLYLYGPGLAREYNLQRKIIKGRTYKNWRLNGEFVDNPQGDDERFNILKPGDYIIFDFGGELRPSTARAILVAADNRSDQSLHQEISTFMGSRSMRAIDSDTLTRLIDDASPDEQHPIWDLTLDVDLEDAAMGGIEGIQRLRKRPSSKTMTQSTLDSARQNASRIGQAGEEFVNAYLTNLLIRSEIQAFQWVSAENAISPCDFWVQFAEEKRVVDVKATESGFKNRIHISYNELLQMARGNEPYDIYRVYHIRENTARMRVMRDMKEFAEEILHTLEQLPDGVDPDSISISPEALDFGPECILELYSDEEEESLEEEA